LAKPATNILRQVISPEQIQKRVRELGRQISDDYRGETVFALGLLENSFMFMADLVRAVDVPIVCTFIKPTYKQTSGGEAPVLEIFSAMRWRSKTNTCCWWKACCTPASPPNF